MAAIRLLRQALTQQLRAGAQYQPAYGLPGHVLQADFTCLQTRTLSFHRSTLHAASILPQQLQASCRQTQPPHNNFQDRNFATQSAAPVKGTGDAASKPDQPVVSNAQKPAGPVSHMRTGMIKPVFISPNVLMEPYQGPPVRIPFLASWFSLPGWRARKERFMSNIKSMYAIAKLKKSVKPFSLKLFKEDALKVYEETCQVLAEGDQSRLRQATTPALFGDMKREIKARQDGGWRSVRWKMLKRPRLNQINIVHGRIMAQNPKDDKTAWVQLTASIPSEQSFAAYDSKRELVAGDPNKGIRVYDTWVFERALKKDPTSRWRCAGRLSIAYPAASKAQIAAPQQAQDPTVQAALQQTAGLAEVAQPEQVKRKGKKRTRVAAAA